MADTKFNRPPKKVWRYLVLLGLLPLWLLGSLLSSEEDSRTSAQTTSAAAQEATAPVQQAGLLIVRKSVEEILHIPDGQETLELPLTVGQNTVRIALPANATDAEIETRPTDKPYMMCFEGKGCFVSNPGEHWDADFDFDTTIFWFQGVEPGVTMIITPIGR